MLARLKETYPALSQRNFRYFWFGQCISLIGTWMQATAQQWLVYTLTKSALLLGLLGVAQFGPVMFLSQIVAAFGQCLHSIRVTNSRRAHSQPPFSCRDIYNYWLL